MSQAVEARAQEQVAAPTHSEPRRVGVTIGGAIESERPNNQIAVTLITAGESKNRLTYSPEVLRTSAQMWEGVSAFLDHPDMLDNSRAGGRSVRDLAGNYSDIVFDGHALKARLNILAGTHTGDTAKDLIKTVLAAQSNDEPAPNIGISADMIVRKLPNREGGFTVEEIMRVNSADIVVNPSAGGTFDRALEQTDLAGLIDHSTAPAAGNPPPPPPPPGTTGLQTNPANDQLAVLRTALSGELLASQLDRCKLPQGGKDLIRRQFEGREFIPADLTTSIDDMRSLDCRTDRALHRVRQRRSPAQRQRRPERQGSNLSCMGARLRIANPRFCQRRAQVHGIARRLHSNNRRHHAPRHRGP